MSAAAPSLPERLAGLVQEARWLILAACAAYLAIVLAGYDRADPGWSHAGAGHVVNPGGRFGAWLADVLLYLFGLSAWWWVAFFAFLVVLGYRRLGLQEGSDRRPFLIAAAGFAVLLAASSGLEALRFHSAQVELPFLPGGVAGYEVARAARRYLGFTGATLLLLALIAASFSLFSGLSWIDLAERTGALVERAASAMRLAWEKWRDRRIGREVAGHREEVIEHERLRQNTHEPVRIEPAALELPRSERVEKERQQPLFEDLPENLLPPLALLDESSRDAEPPSPETLEFTSRLIERKLGDFGVEVKVLAALPGPVITRYEIEPAVGVKGSQIVNLVKDLARALSVVSIRVIETIPGKSCMGLEIPNARRQIVHLAEILGSVPFHEMHSPLALALGKDIGGAPVVADLARMPHLLVAGTTGSGKSVAINAMILSLLYKSEPDTVRLILVDPKMLELSAYEGIPHLAAPVVTDMRHAANALAWCVGEMEHRYRRMSALAVRNLSGYNHKVREAQKAGKPIDDPLRADASQPEPLQPMPHVVVVIDELADLMMVAGKKVEELIARLAQKARAAGIHLILATQRPSVDVITGLIKANIPTRIAFQVSARVDSRTILDQSGADTLLGQGDMLFLMAGSGTPVRVHGAFVSDGEVQRVVDYLKRLARPDYVDGILDDPVEPQAETDPQAAAEDDPLYDQAVEIVLRTRRPSISLVQRHLRIGYNRAARLIEQMERNGLVSAMGANGNREVLSPSQD